MTDIRTISKVLEGVASEYPPDLRSGQEADVARIAFHISLISAQCGKGSTVCDIGGGIGMFSVGCAALGMSATLVDDFCDRINQTTGFTQLPVHDKHGVSVLRRNVVDEPLGLAHESFDAITCFDCIEHLHHSPKRLLHESMTLLKAGGLFVLSGPNCVNLRKRLTVPFGKGRWSAMSDWYDEDVFRGHVREPSVADLRHIGEDLGLSGIRIIGRNWMGFHSKRTALRLVMPAIDGLLRPFPSLCSNIYLIGRKMP